MSRIFCPYHADGSTMATNIGLFDDEETGVEMAQFQCEGDPVHTWEHPSQGFYLRVMGWGLPLWKIKRDKYRTL